MRLSQLAKQVGKKYSDVGNYINDQLGGEVKIHPNGKVDDTLIEKVIAHFGLVEQAPIVEKEIKKEAKIVEPIVEQQKEAIPKKTADTLEDLNDKNKIEEEEIEIEFYEVDEEIKEASESLETETKSISENNDSTEEFENPGTSTIDEKGIIRAQRPEKLKGIKVIDKIELPQPKAPEPTKSEDKPEEIKETKVEDDSHIYVPEKPRRKNIGKRKKVKKPLTLAEQRAKEIEDKKKLKVKEQKLQKKENLNQYKSNYKANQTKEKKKKTVVTKKETIIEEKPKTLFGRFWKWMNT